MILILARLLFSVRLIPSFIIYLIVMGLIDNNLVAQTIAVAITALLFNGDS